MRRRVRILHVVGDSKFGGASLGILRLAKFWKSLGWSVEILSTDEALSDHARREGVKLLPLDVIWREVKPWKDLCGLWRLFRHLRRNDYTLVHTHTTKAGFIGRIAAWAARVPIVVHTSHGFAFHEASSKSKIAFFSVMERIASWGCKRVVTVSHFHKTWGAALGIAPTKKLVAIPNGIPDAWTGVQRDAQAVEKARAGCGVSMDEFMIFTPGRLAPEKGLEDLIESTALVAARLPQRFKVVIAGEGALRHELELLIDKCGLAERVRLIGFREDIPKLLAAADLVVLPTWREGLSIALLEAMALGCPIITTRIGSNREACADGQSAHLVDPKQPAQLAQAICDLVNDAGRRKQFAHNARQAYLEHYTHDRMLSGYHNLYLELLKELEHAESVSPLLPSLHR